MREKPHLISGPGVPIIIPVTFLAVEPRQRSRRALNTLPRVRFATRTAPDLVLHWRDGVRACRFLARSFGHQGTEGRGPWRQALAAADLVAERFRTAARTLGVGQR